jgi:hypothetical protein
MVPSMRKTPALVAAVVTFLALVAGMASVPTAQADDQADQYADALAARRVPTKFKKIVWPATPAVYGTPTYVNGKIKGKKVKKRRRRPPAEAALGLAEGGQGQDQRQGPVPPQGQDDVVPQEDQAAGRRAGHPQGRRATRARVVAFTVNPAYAPQGNSGAWSRIAPGYKIQYNPCAPVRWRLNTQYAPDGVKPEVKTALRQLGAATGIRFVYTGKTKANPGLQPQVARQHQHGGRLGRPQPDQVEPLRQHHRSRRPAQDGVRPHGQGQAGLEDHPLRPGHGQHVRGARRLRRTQRARVDHRPRARSRRRHRSLVRLRPADVPLGREHRQRRLPGPATSPGCGTSASRPDA